MRLLAALMDLVLVFVVLAFVMMVLVALTMVVVVILVLIVSKHLVFPLKVKWDIETLIMMVLEMARSGVFLRPVPVPVLLS
jgi:hypothetical protein